MARPGDKLIEYIRRALLREPTEVTHWIRITTSQEQRQAAIEREADAYH
ncbi:hypothetical protein [Microvirga soli]|nr:hypothetical protein [Microvirga soli]